MALSFVFGWNNGPVVVGNLTGSGSVPYRRALILTAAGFLVGTLLGWKSMETSLIGSTSNLGTSSAIALVFGISFVLMVVLTLVKIPVSLSVSVVGAYLGIVIALHRLIYTSFTELVIASWLLAPAFGALLSLGLERAIRKASSSMNIITADTLNRLLIQATVFYVTFSLGLNNIGLIFGTYTLLEGFSYRVLFLIVGSSILGMVLLGKAFASSIGEKLVGISPAGTLASFIASSIILVASTYAKIPMSITMALVGAMIGVGVSSKLWMVNRRIVTITISSWFIVAAVSALIAYVLSV